MKKCLNPNEMFEKKLKFQKKGGIIKMEVKTDDVPNGIFNYENETQHFTPINQVFTDTYILGAPNDLKANKHRWNFTICNMTKEKKSAKLEISWHQNIEGSTVLINQWKLNNIELLPGESKTINDEIMIDPE